MIDRSHLQTGLSPLSSFSLPLPIIADVPSPFSQFLFFSPLFFFYYYSQWQFSGIREIKRYDDAYRRFLEAFFPLPPDRSRLLWRKRASPSLPRKNCCFTVDRSLIRVSYRLQDSWFEMEKQMRFVSRGNRGGYIIKTKKKKKYGSPRFSFFFGRNLSSFSLMSFKFSSFFLSLSPIIESFPWNPVILALFDSFVLISDRYTGKYKFATNDNRSIKTKRQRRIISFKGEN